MKSIITLLLSLACFHLLNAQHIFNRKEKPKAAYARIGIEPTYVFSMGYMQHFVANTINRDVLVYGEISSPTKAFGIQNYEAKAGGILSVLKMKSLGITYQLNFSTGHVQTKNFASQKYALGNKLAVGYYKPKWFISLGGEYERIFANKITHTAYYRDFIFPEAKNGWYKGAGGNVQVGIETGITIKEVLDFRLELKVPMSERFNSYNGSPGHINLSTGFRF